MNNPFLLNTLSSQGFRYLLFYTAEQKKEYSVPPAPAAPAAPTPRISAAQTRQTPEKTVFTAPNRQEQPSANQFQISRQTAPSAQSKNPTPIPASGKTAKNQHSEEPQENFLRQAVLPFSAWPAAWKQIHKRCQLPAERPKNLSRQIVWTYSGLEYDLFTDTPSDKRRQLLAQIIKTLSLPKGTHIFLPCRTVTAETSEPAFFRHENKEYSFFWSAIDLIRPRVLVVFGEQCLSDIGLPPMLPTQKYTLLPVTVYALDSVMVYAENAKENEIMINFLCANLKIFA